MKTVSYDETIWQLVPIEATSAMHNEATPLRANVIGRLPYIDDDGHIRGALADPSEVWRVMSAAAPPFG